MGQSYRDPPSAAIGSVLETSLICILVIVAVYGLLKRGY